MPRYLSFVVPAEDGKHEARRDDAKQETENVLATAGIDASVRLRLEGGSGAIEITTEATMDTVRKALAACLLSNDLVDADGAVMTMGVMCDAPDSDENVDA